MMCHAGENSDNCTVGGLRQACTSSRLRWVPERGKDLAKVQHLEALGSREQGCCAGFDLAREQ